MSGEIVLKWIREIGCGDVDWIELDQDMAHCRALVNMVLNFRVP
jgi:hypothetical protein